MYPDQTLSAFDRFLVAEGLRFEAVVIGGAALALLGITQRQTRDCDVLDPVLPEEIARTAREPRVSSLAGSAPRVPISGMTGSTTGLESC